MSEIRAGATGTGGRTLVLVHGRGFKPAAAELLALWRSALRAGIARDAPERLPAFDALRVELVYYGDAIGRVLEAAGRRYDAALDLADQRNTLALLAARSKSKEFRREHYESLPGKTPLKEFLADIGAPALAALGLKRRAIGRYLPELVEYWRAGSPVQVAGERLAAALSAAFDRGDRVLLASHCIGAVVAFDVLWHLSRGTGGRPGESGRKVERWLTFGSPLSDESVKSHLAGASRPVSERYPANVIEWWNFAAEDDYVCHDETAADDFSAMLGQRLLSRIEDVRMYNLAVRYGRSNPHNALGYLVHPRVTRVLADWLQEGSP